MGDEFSKKGDIDVDINIDRYMYIFIYICLYIYIFLPPTFKSRSRKSLWNLHQLSHKVFILLVAEKEGKAPYVEIWPCYK